MLRQWKGSLVVFLCGALLSNYSRNAFALQDKSGGTLKVHAKGFNKLAGQVRDVPKHQSLSDTVTVRELSNGVQARSRHLQQEGLKAFYREDFDAAEHLMEEALKLTPSDWTIYNNIGVDRACRKEINKAAIWFEQGLALAPHEIMITGNLGLMRWLQGRIEESYSMLGKAISMGYSPPVVHYAMGIICLQKGLPSEAAEHLSRVKDRTFRYRDLFLSFAFLAQGKLDTAKECYRKYFRMNPVQYALIPQDLRKVNNAALNSSPSN